MKNLFLLLLLVQFFLLAACTVDDVEVVKNGMLNGYESTTVGKAFNASFDNPMWESFETDKGQRVVEFTGLVSNELHQAHMNSIMNGYDAASANGMEFQYVQLTSLYMSGEEFDKLVEHWDEQGADNPMRAAIYEVFDKYNTLWKVGTPVTVQWTIDANGEGFATSYWESEAWIDANGNVLSLDNILAYIYG
ncbi:hypothetical protein [Oceanidesulfovibrio marinus]|uniref:Uncharacterized protein n=1 Tax=Oceanidesulfovibrio marinus TaxID=370038 RepID=A0A6P1ZDG3_9BACT|nr:hypothetical protein [Oceanidesulfovibrio marinus]TVM31605.1 hypothetical protein DQK91_18250 [Oceanidesulfovibrio marinus]